MTRERIEQEIDTLKGDIAAKQRDIILADGAIQALRYILDHWGEPAALAQGDGDPGTPIIEEPEGD